MDFIRFIFLYHHVSIKISCMRPYVGPGQIAKLGLKPLQHELGDKIWSLDKISMISLLELCRTSVKDKQGLPNSAANEGGVGKVSFSNVGEDTLYYYYNGEFVRIGLDCEFEWESEYAEIPMSVASYEQNQYGALAWLFEVTYNSKGGMISVKLPVVKLDNGNYELLDSIINSQHEYNFEIIPKLSS